jgi:predicted SAM-dependent methyltransferase
MLQTEVRRPSSSEATAATKLTLKQRLGNWLIPRLPFSKHVFGHIRTELDSILVRTLNALHPRYRRERSELRTKKAIKANLGCGPFGQDGWVNLDLFPLRNVTLRTDCRRSLPLSDASCKGIHVEHFFEHMSHDDESRVFLGECRRCLQVDGILRIIVPDAEVFVRAYLDDGWSSFQRLAAVDDQPENNFPTKMEALNHVFVQGYEHFGGYDFLTLSHVLKLSGFREVHRRSFRQGAFPDGCIDRDQHRPYSLYVEATK